MVGNGVGGGGGGGIIYIFLNYEKITYSATLYQNHIYVQGKMTF